MDVLNQEEIKIMEGIIKNGDRPVLMINQNRYKPGMYPNSKEYIEWRKINQQMLDAVGGKILWSLPVKGQLLVNGHSEILDEIMAYWYPSHASILGTRGLSITKRNFELRQELIDYAIIHRVDGENPPKL